MEREKLIYQRLGNHHNGILRHYETLENALVLQYACHGSIRQYIARQRKPVAFALQLRWIEQITASIDFVHSQNVLHGDISCNNVFLDQRLDEKLGDFAGSSIDGHDPLICYETSHENPETEGISTRSELFALGFIFYEIMTDSKPYKELSDSDISDAYAQGKYPSLVFLPAFIDIIDKCWAQDYASVDELLKFLNARVTAKSSLASWTQPFTFLHSPYFPAALAIVSPLPLLLWTRNRR